jgi:hypothetical protein
VTSDGRYENGRPGRPLSARLGDLRADLDLLDLDEDAFVDRVAGDAPDPPPNYETVVAVNAGREAVAPGEAIELELGPNNCAA